MRICFVSPIYPIKSDPRLGIFVHELSKYLVRQKQEVHVITLGYKEDNEYEARDGVRVYRVRLSRSNPFRNIFMIFSVSKKLLQLNRKYNFDVINAHFVGKLTLVVGILSKMMRKPLVTTAYGIGLLADKGLSKAILWLNFALASKIVCVSNYVAKLVARHTKKEKITIIIVGMDPEKLRPSKSASEFRKEYGLKHEKVLLSVAGLVERKGIDLIINALPDVVRQVPSLKYFVIGRGQQKNRLVELTNRLGLKQHVVFIDYVNENDLANFYNMCDVFALMSRTIKEKEGVEGLGIAYLEASYSGKPVIAGRSGGTADGVIDGITGYRIAPANKKELAAKLIKLFRDKKLREKLGSNGRKLVQEKLLWEHNVNSLLEVYKSVFAAGKSHRKHL